MASTQNRSRTAWAPYLAAPMLFSAGCGPRQSWTPPPTTPVEPLAIASVSPPAAAPTATTAAPASPKTPPTACTDPGRGTRVACDATRILVDVPLAFHPKRALPPEPALTALRAVGALMRQRTDIQMLRIEAYSGKAVGNSTAARRRALKNAQARADAVFRYLWLKQRVSAERQEPVGYAAQTPDALGNERWPIVLRIVQRRNGPSEDLDSRVDSTP